MDEEKTVSLKPQASPGCSPQLWVPLWEVRSTLPRDREWFAGCFCTFAKKSNLQNLIQKFYYALKTPSLLRIFRNLKSLPNVPMGFLTKSKVIAEGIVS